MIGLFKQDFRKCDFTSLCYEQMMPDPCYYLGELRPQEVEI